jgi:hypothetical protein
MTAMIECPDRAELNGLIAGHLPPDRQEALERHLDHCGRCRQELDELCGGGTVVPDGPVPQCLSPSPSDALKRVMADLASAPERSSPPAGGVEARPGYPFSLLQPTDRPGFLGRLGAYDIRREIGRGGMGVVFEGLDPALNRTVAIKVLSPLAVMDEEARGRFLREAQAAAALEHEHVVTVHAVDQVAGMPFLVMQYVAGESLADRLARDKRLPLADVVRIGVQVARGLAAAHAKGLVHRDIKPANIILDAATGRTKIADFGLAKSVGDTSLTTTGTVAGTPEFMSPEQAAGGLGGEVVDARSDLFSLGVVLYVASSGVSPFRAESPLLALDRVRREEPVPLDELDPSLPKWFSAVVGRLMMKDPADRLSSAEELAALLEQRTEPPTAVLHAPAPARPRYRRAVVVALAVLVGVAVAAGVYFGRPDRTPGEQPPDTTTPAPPREPGFYIAGQPTRYADLAQAAAAAPDDAVIEVSGDGPFPTLPVRLTGKPLTIRAAPGSRPVITAAPPGEVQPGPLLRTDADLQLEGLELRWAINAPKGGSEEMLLEHCVIVNSRGRLALVHCQFTPDSGTVSVGASGRELVLKNCYFPGPDGVAVFWRPEPDGRVRVEGCQFETRMAFSVYCVAETKDLTPATVLLAGNTFTSTEFVRLLLNLDPKQPLKFTARGNVFDDDRLVMIWVAANPKKYPNQPDKAIGLLRSFVGWKDEANVYRRGCEYLASGVGLAGAAGAGITTLAEWGKHWDPPPAGSIEGVIHFRERTKSPVAQPLRLDRVGDASGEVPPGVGADPDRLGPR